MATRTVKFDDSSIAEQAGAIAERVCDDVSVDGIQVTLVDDMSVIGSALREIELCGLTAIPVM